MQKNLILPTQELRLHHNSRPPSAPGFEHLKKNVLNLSCSAEGFEHLKKHVLNLSDSAAGFEHFNFFNRLKNMF